MAIAPQEGMSLKTIIRNGNMKAFKRIEILILLLMIMPGLLPVRLIYTGKAYTAAYNISSMEKTADGVLRWVKSQVGETSGKSLLGGSISQQAGSSDGDWYAIAIGRLGYEDDYTSYLSALKSYVENKYKTDGGLDENKATEYHRIILTILALGGDPTSIGNDSNGNPINLVSDGTYNRGNKAELGLQGINGLIWGLIAMDSLSYKVPDGAHDTRSSIITDIIKRQNPDGSFSLNGEPGDVDITAMAVQALAPYYNSEEVYEYTIKATGEKVSFTVRQVIDKAIDCLSSLQGDEGDFKSYGSYNSEGTAQVIIALCSLGIDPLGDQRFIKNGHTLLDGLMKYKNEDGGFAHSLREDNSNPSSPAGVSDIIAGQQSLCAITAIIRYEQGLRRLYDFRPEMPEELKQKIASLDNSIEKLEMPSGASSQEYIQRVKKLFDEYIEIPAYERSYVKNYNKLSDIMKYLNMENTSEYLSNALGQNSNGCGSIINLFTKLPMSFDGIFDENDMRLYESLPDKITTRYYQTVVSLIEEIQASDNKEDYSRILEDLQSKMRAIELLQQEIEEINTLVLQKLYPVDSISLKDEKLLNKVLERADKLGAYDKEQILKYDDLLKAQKHLRSLKRNIAVGTAAILAASGAAFILIKRSKKKTLDLG